MYLGNIIQAMKLNKWMISQIFYMGGPKYMEDPINSVKNFRLMVTNFEENI